MSDTRVAVKPYVIGPSATSFVVPAAASFLAFNPSGAGANLVFSDSNRTITLSGAHAAEGASGTTFQTTGAVYVEFKAVTVSLVSGLQDYYITDGFGNSGTFEGASGNFTWNNTNNITGWVSGDVIGFAIDFTAKIVFISQNGTFNPPQDVGTQFAPTLTWTTLGGPLGVQVTLDTSIGPALQAMSICGNSTNQTYPPPSGYSRWDGY